MTVNVTSGAGFDATQQFREAMARFPSGVTIVTTADADGRWWGFTATSFCSVSMEPPLALVCIADKAECHAVFAEADSWNIHIISLDHGDLAMRFATRGADKFGGGQFVEDGHGLPRLQEASVTLHCTRHASVSGGDHTMLIGRVERIELGEPLPAFYFRRAFHPFAPAV